MVEGGIDLSREGSLVNAMLYLIRGHKNSAVPVHVCCIATPFVDKRFGLCGVIVPVRRIVQNSNFETVDICAAC